MAFRIPYGFSLNIDVPSVNFLTSSIFHGGSIATNVIYLN
jgi:hypothetical protein